MCCIENELSHILKGLDIHKCQRMNHSHLSQLVRQLTASLDKASIEIDVEFQRFLIVVLCKLFQFWTEIAAVGIWRICHSHVEACGKNIEESDGIIHQGEAVGIAALATPKMKLLT